MATPRRIRNLRLKIEKLEQELELNKTVNFAAGRGWLTNEAKALDLKLSRQFHTVQKDLKFAEEMEQLRIKQEREIEAYRIKLELKTLNRIAAIDEERKKIRDLTDGYALNREAKEAEKEERKHKAEIEATMKEVEAKNPTLAKALKLQALNPGMTMEQAFKVIQGEEENQIIESLDFLIAQDEKKQEIIEQYKEEDRIKEFDLNEIQTSSTVKVEDDGLSFLDVAFKPPEKSFMEKLKEQGASVPVLDVKIEKEEKAS